MKEIRIVFLCFLFFFMNGRAFAGDNSVPENWSPALKAGARDMIESGVEADKAVLMIRHMLKARFEEKFIVRAGKLVSTSQKLRLPAEEIIGKAREGIAKQVPAAMVVQAMDRVKSRYEYSFAQAGKLTKNEREKQRLGRIIASGITAGLSVEDMNAIVIGIKAKLAGMDAVQGQVLATEIMEAARDMARQGVASGTVAKAMTRAMQRGQEKGGYGKGGRANGGSGSGNAGNTNGSGSSGNGSGGSGGQGSGNGGSGGGSGGGRGK